MLIIDIFAIILGFTLLVLGGNRLVEAAIVIADRWQLPKAVIAATLIAGGTSLPEVITSFIAAFEGHNHAALGNALGSNIFNVLAVGGLALILQPSEELKRLRPLWLLLTLSTVTLILALRNSEIQRYEGGLFLFGLMFFFWLSFQQEKDTARSLSVSPQLQSPWWVASLAGAGLLLGARLALWGALDLGVRLGWNERMVAITLLATGTGLPELTTSLIAAYKKHGDMALANIMGSNVINTLAIGGITGSIFTLKIQPQFFEMDLWVLFISTMMIGGVFALKGAWPRRSLGLTLTLGYLLYIGSIIDSL